jgi:hypothetical protein
MTSLITDREKIIHDNQTTVGLCYICGHEILGCQAAASTIDSEFYDWVAHGMQSISLQICEECWIKILENIKKDIEMQKKGKDL